MIPTRPIMRYHGGKWRLAPWIIANFPPHSTYIEPFSGGASVLLRKSPVAHEIYNDLDGEIVNVFRVLRDAKSATELARLLALTPFARTEYDAAFEPCVCPVEAARRTIVRSFMGHGSSSATQQYKSGFRNLRRDSASPAWDLVDYPLTVTAFTQRLRQVIIECRPALDIISRYDGTSTLYYVDPPYVESTRGTHGRCYRHEMSETEHEELAMALKRLRGMVIISGYDSPLYRRLYAGWRVVKRKTHAFGYGSKRPLERTEQLWISPRTAAAMPQYSLLEVV